LRWGFPRPAQGLIVSLDEIRVYTRGPFGLRDRQLIEPACIAIIARYSGSGKAAVT
jgi:hypothetical protein